MKFECDAPSVPPLNAPTDWSALKEQITSKLDVASEFERLGVRFSRPGPNRKGNRECHAIDRPDNDPSAFVNLETAIYHDSGGEGQTLHLFDLALKYGSFGRWIDVVRQYADQAGVAIGPVSFGKGGRIKEAEYIYRDAAGSPSYRVVRYRLPNGVKKFSQHGSDGRGGWRYGTGAMDGVPPLPYRLPELLASDPEEPIWIVEGEKCAERLAALGLIATTNHQGSHSTDRTWPLFLDYFKDREIFILPDNDTPGRLHAEKVAGHLAPVARLVKVIGLSGLPLKGDVFDWLDMGNDIGQLGQIAYKAPLWEPNTQREAEAAALLTKDATLADLRRVQTHESWWWPSWIPQAAITLLAAEPGTGKTRWIFDLHRRIHHGLTWPDGTPINLPRDARFLWIAADNQWQELLDIAQEYGIPDELIYLNTFADDPYDGTSLQTVEDLMNLEARIKRVQPSIVAIDTITNTGDFKTQDSVDAKKQYKPLQDICVRCTVPLLCSTHTNTAGKVLGRRAVEKARVVLQLDCPDPEGQPHRRKLWVPKSKAIKPAALGVTMATGGNDYDLEPPEPPEVGAVPRLAGAKRGPLPVETTRCAEWLTERLSRGRERVRTIRQAGEAAGFSAPTLYKARDLIATEEEIDSYKFWSLKHGEANGTTNGQPF